MSCSCRSAMRPHQPEGRRDLLEEDLGPAEDVLRSKERAGAGEETLQQRKATGDHGRLTAGGQPAPLARSMAACTDQEASSCFEGTTTLYNFMIGR